MVEVVDNDEAVTDAVGNVGFSMQPDHKFSVTSELLDNERLVEDEACSLSSTFSVFIEFLKLTGKLFEFF